MMVAHSGVWFAHITIQAMQALKVKAMQALKVIFTTLCAVSLQHVQYDNNSNMTNLYSVHNQNNAQAHNVQGSVHSIHVSYYHHFFVNIKHRTTRSLNTLSKVQALRN